MSDPYIETIKGMGREVYDSMLNALQTGRWPDGRLITSEQREHCMQAVISWGELNLPRDQRIGYIDKAHKASDSHDDAQPIKWRQNEEDL